MGHGRNPVSRSRDSDDASVDRWTVATACGFSGRKGPYPRFNPSRVIVKGSLAGGAAQNRLTALSGITR